MTDLLARRYPEAERQPVRDVLHGVAVDDPYRWLEDADDPATIAWTAAQQQLYRDLSPDWFDAGIHGRLVELSTIGYLSAPVARGGRLFQLRLTAGRDHPQLILRDADGERVLLDPAASDPSGQTVLDAWQPSIEGDLVAVQLSTAGREESRLEVLDVVTGVPVEAPIDRVRRSSIAWLPGGRAFYYVRRLPDAEPGRYRRRVFRHTLGTSAEDDPVIFGAGRADTDFYSVAVNPHRPCLVVTASAGAGAGREIWWAALPDENPRLQQLNLDPAERPTLHFTRSDEVVVLLHASGRIIRFQADGRPLDLVQAEPGQVLTDLAVLDGIDEPQLLVVSTRHAISELTVHRLADGALLETVALPGRGVVGRLSGADDQAWFSYTDPTRTESVLNYRASTRTAEEWAAPAGWQHSMSVVSSLLSCRSADGTEVRVFVLAPHARPDRPRPAVLTGYGGFGAVMAPVCQAEGVAWAEAGGVYAVVGVRGGGEEGEAWHLAGSRLNKQRGFDDFDAAAAMLVEQGWTTPEQLGIWGTSNGGLLVGAALTQHPERYAAAVCVSPLQDMVRYELSGLGPSWRAEYGSVEDRAEFENLLSYSPYHAVRPGVRYPAVLFVGFEGDTRVDLLHLRKMCAALQQASTGAGPIAIRFEGGVGHGARAVSREVGALSDCFGFLAHQLGLRR